MSEFYRADVSVPTALVAVLLVALGIAIGLAYARFQARRKKQAKKHAISFSPEIADWLFRDSAATYYVAGRYCVFARPPSSVSANLLHHAVEMFLKAALHRTMNLEGFRGLNHDLPKLWAAFRQAFPTTPAQSFAQVIGALHEFEELRYPDLILPDGASISILHGPRPSTPSKTTAQPERRYELWLDEIDELVGVILQHGRINPDFVFGSEVFRAEAREFLSKENKQPWSQREG